jgi:hypothetical protein
MDIEKLTKSQIVLLTLLVSFVTSIATGIVTVSLMQQAPPSVAETVDRVIENTIETVATSTKNQSAAVATTQEKTVVVNEADLIAQSVKQVSPSVVRIYSSDQTQFFGLGVVIDASGTVATDIGALGGAQSAVVELQSGTQVDSSVTSRDQSFGMVFLTPATSTSPMPKWLPATLLQSDPQLGDVVVAISGQKLTAIAQGLVTQIDPSDPSTNVPETLVTDIDPSSILPGSPIIDTNGDVVGVSTGVSRASSASGFIPTSVIGTTNDQN